jgi:hypothetical protein
MGKKQWGWNEECLGFTGQDALNGRGLFLLGPSSSASSSLQTSSWPLSRSSAVSSMEARVCSWATLGEEGDWASLFGLICAAMVKRAEASEGWGPRRLLFVLSCPASSTARSKLVTSSGTSLSAKADAATCLHRSQHLLYEMLADTVCSYTCRGKHARPSSAYNHAFPKTRA